MTGPRDARLELVERFFAGTGPTYDLVVNAATFGIDRWWKRQIARRLPSRPRRILDLACGTGISTFALARRFPASEVVGVELRAEYLERARAKQARLGLGNVRFVLARAEEYADPEPFDAVVSSYLAKYADLPVLAGNAFAMLRPGGLVLMHDFTFPPTPALVRIWRVYFRVLQRIGTPLLPRWREIFFGLPRLIETTRWPEELAAALAAAGFERIRLEPLTAHGSALMTAYRPLAK